MKQKTKKMWNKVANTVAGVGAINWGLVALLDLNLVTTILGNYPTIVTIVYSLVAVSGIAVLWNTFRG